MTRWLTAMVVCSCAWSAEPSEFYIVSEGFSDAIPGWHRSVLEVKPDGDGVLVRYIRSGPASQICGNASSIVTTSTRLTDTSLHDVTPGLNLCAMNAASVDRVIRAHPPTKQKIAMAGDRFSIVAKCGADTRVIRLPGDWEMDMAGLKRWQRRVAALWTLEKTIGTRAFGPFPQIDVIPSEMNALLQPAGESVLAELKSGKFDAGLRGGSFRSDVAALRPVGPEMTVELLDRKNFPIEHYVQPQYPPLALQARIGGIVELSIASGDVTVISGHPLLTPAASKAAKQWRFPPGTVNRVKIEFATHCR